MNLRRAFTLVELLVVIGVIAVLAGLVLAVGGGVAARGERQQMQDAFSLLDQAVTELEESRGQPLVFKRVNGTKSDDLPFYDVLQLQVAASAGGADYIIESLVELLSRNPRSREYLNRISPDILIRSPHTVNGQQLTYIVRDPWGEPVKAYPCGRPATRKEMKFARDNIKAGKTTVGDANCDPLTWGIDLEDGTVRTNSEKLSNIACAGRKWLFFSKGPDRKDGQPPWDGNGLLDENKDGVPDWDDNVFSHEPLRPNA